ncbi:OmpP1/FadL family transporter [Helicobacter trogontum]|uniref:OmpP1/FadL family transporter n=1 Tax=Helicobacter trogontum TaxID=50960 RepID=UPI000CF1725F|nr:outer membrane protein transport protein [Helicobacter trogontum]
MQTTAKNRKNSISKEQQKKFFAGATAVAASCVLVHASGFRLPEQSLNGTALNSAYIAGAYGADASYYNPANMSFGRESNVYSVELDGSLIFIPGFSFTTGDRSVYECANNNQCATQVSGSAKTTLQPVPKFFFKTRAYGTENWKTSLGFSFTTPSGLSMDWNGAGGGFLDDVGIAMLELNPVVSLSYKDIVSFGGGFRAIYTSGSFNNTLYVPYSLGGIINGVTKTGQESNAADWGFGYNVATTIKPFVFIENTILNSTIIAITYRSEVALNMKGKLTSKSYIDGFGMKGVVGMDADLTLFADLPHILNIAISQDYGRIRAEFVYERTFYGSARIFEFAYTNQYFYNIEGNLKDTAEAAANAANYDAVKYGNGWRDASAYRLGVTYFGDKWTFMGGVAYDETPASQGKFGIPDADAYIMSFGLRRNFIEDKLNVGLGYSLALKDNRKSFIQSKDGLGQLHLLTIGAKYTW